MSKKGKINNSNNSFNLKTKWAKNINIDCPFPEYPRPQFKRERWLNLNGKWKYLISNKKERFEKINLKKSSDPDFFDGEILVPFPVESYLSGVQKPLKPNQKLWYYREFQIPEEWNFSKENQKILLNIGAADWKTEVWINGEYIGQHLGGYTPFSFDITKALKEDNNCIIISCWDPTDKGLQERGKQVLKPWGIFYTAVSGIWQTIWLEPVSKDYIKGYRVSTDIDNALLKLDVFINGRIENKKIIVKIPQNNIEIEENKQFKRSNEETPQFGCSFKIKIEDQKLWSPDEPNLYDIQLILEENGDILDKVDGYFGMRKISLKKDDSGITRIALNNEILFLYGPLDQGYWPDGLYTAPTDEALRYDIEIAKKIGFNMIRKHIKVEPARWYYHCDKLGMLVWQDMPNGGQTYPGAISGILFKGKILIEKGRHKKKVQQHYYEQLKSMILSLYNHPCIVMWIPFNEGWGQFKTEKAVQLIRQLDSTRLINNASGWVDCGIGNIHDIHSYPDPKMPPLEENRAAVCGEFGGLGLEVEGHMWLKNRKWGYRKFENPQKLEEKYAELMDKLAKLKEKGLAAAVYTQITDVEGEVNGLITYDREILKIKLEKLQNLHQNLLNKI
ncbi:MAG: glycoside hydrolase family 2 protein [Promethearchaeota archaeon]